MAVDLSHPCTVETNCVDGGVTRAREPRARAALQTHLEGRARTARSDHRPFSQDREDVQLEVVQLEVGQLQTGDDGTGLRPLPLPMTWYADGDTHQPNKA